jgi:hypothetical protein
MTTRLHAKLNPERFPNMSPQMAAIMGYLLDREYTTPALAEMTVTTDGAVLARVDGEGRAAFLGAEADLRANLRRLGMAAGLDEQEWAGYLAMVRGKLGIMLEDPRPETRDPRPETRDPEA